MSKFIGEICQYCHKELTENDDVVVCPECGSPYHRECYSICGQCVRADLHESGQSYTSNIKHNEEKVEIRCPNCNAPNEIDRDFCGRCGFPLKQKAEQGFNTATMVNPYYFDENEEVEDGISAGDVSKYLGQNSGYFISKYLNMKKSGLPISINFSALFLNYMYLIYRKKYVLGIVFAIILMVLNIPTTVAYLSEMISISDFPQLSFLTETFIAKMITVSRYTEILKILVEVGISVFFNWFYMKSVIKKVKKLKGIYDSDFETVATKQGGVLTKNVVLLLLGIYLGMSFILPLLI